MFIFSSFYVISYPTQGSELAFSLPITVKTCFPSFLPGTEVREPSPSDSAQAAGRAPGVCGARGASVGGTRIWRWVGFSEGSKGRGAWRHLKRAGERRCLACLPPPGGRPAGREAGDLPAEPLCREGQPQALSGRLGVCPRQVTAGFPILRFQVRRPKGGRTDAVLRGHVARVNKATGAAPGVSHAPPEGQLPRGSPSRGPVCRPRVAGSWFRLRRLQRY